MLSPRGRKTVLTLHISTSVGWFGAVLVFVALSIVGVRSEDDQTVRSVYVAMDVLGWSVLVPLALGALVTGVVQSLGTQWGLVRHYWIVFKLLITVVATGLLLLYMRTLASLAAMAIDTEMRVTHGLRSPSPIVHSVAALVLLVMATVLSVFKPRGLTPWGWRKASSSA